MIFHIHQWTGCCHEEVVNTNGERINPKASMTLSAVRKHTEAPYPCPICSDPHGSHIFMVTNVLPGTKAMLRNAPNYNPLPSNQEMLQICQTAIDDKVRKYRILEREHLEILVATQIDKLFEDGTLFESNGVVEIKEATINNNAFNNKTISHNKTASYNKVNDYMKAIKVNKPTNTKPTMKNPTPSKRINSVESTYTSNHVNKNALFNITNSIDNINSITNFKLVDLAKAAEEVCTFVIPKLKKVKITRPK